MSNDVKAVDPNAAVAVFLDTYCNGTVPLNYAVMLTGPWGAGKTHFLKAYLADRDKEHLYISLYGITSTTEIDDQIYRQLHPVLSSKYAKLGGIIARAVMKGALKLDFNNDGRDDGAISPSLPEIDLKDFAKNAKSRLLVFDDLERASMKPGPILGYINAFVEHEDAKAVILANEDEIEKNDADFARIKEKLIGQTLAISPSVEAAYPEIVKLVTDQWAATFLETSKAQVLDIFAKSEAKNLRVLKQALWDFERVAMGFRVSDRVHTAELTEILQAILALSIEVRTGRLPKEQLSQLKVHSWARVLGWDREREKTKLEVSEERYPSINLRPKSLDSDLVVGLLTRGYVEASEVQASLDRSPPFISPNAEPSWRRAWHGYGSNDDEYAKSMSALEADFVARTFVDPHVLLHVFGILLKAARIGYCDRSVAQAKTACRAYVDDLVAGDKFNLPAARPERLTTDTGYDGLGYIDSDTGEFRALTSYLQEKIEAAWRKTLPAIALTLHDQLKTAPEEFTQQTTINNSPAPSPFWDVPILHHISPSTFARTLISLGPDVQVTVIRGLATRYERVDAEEVKAAELPWLSKVNRELKLAIPSLGPMSRHRLRSLLDRYLQPLVPLPSKRAVAGSTPPAAAKSRPRLRPKPTSKS